MALTTDFRLDPHSAGIGEEPIHDQVRQADQGTLHNPHIRQDLSRRLVVPQLYQVARREIV